MAAIKGVEQASGVVAEYWRIKRIHLDYDSDQAIVEVDGYVDAKAREVKRAPLTGVVQLSVSGMLSAVMAKGDLRASVYPLLAEQIGFLEGAVSDEV